MTTMIGENDSGKTAIIDFLEIILTNSRPNKEDFHREIVIDKETKKEEEIKAHKIIGKIVFNLNEDEKSNLDKNWLDKNNNLKLKRKYTYDNDFTYIYCRKYNDTRFYEFEDMKASELKKFLQDLKLESERNQDLRKESVKNYIEENDNEIPSTYDWLKISFKEIKNFLPEFIRYGVEDYKNPNNMIFKVLKEVFKNEIYKEGKREFKSEKLKDVLENVENKVKEATNQFKDHIRRYNDKILDITIEPEIDLSSGLKKSPIKVKDQTGVFHYLENRGFGTRKRLFLAIFEWEKEVAANINQEYAIRCYDEPDNNLHIEAQRKLYKTIKSVIEDTDRKNQVLICTHSLFMIDSVPADSINLMKRNKDGSSVVEYLDSFGDNEIKQFLGLMCREMGLSNSHIFFEKCFIAVEGKTEINFLPLAYKKLYGSSLAEDGITLVNLGGNGAAINFLKLLMKNKYDLTILLLDSDTSDSRFNRDKLINSYNESVDSITKEKYKIKVDSFFEERVIYIGDEEFEDVFSNNCYVKVLDKYREKKDGDGWKRKTIEDLRSKDKFSDEIVKLVASNCAPKYINKPELGTYLGQTISKENIPSEIEEIFKQARKIANINN